MFKKQNYLNYYNALMFLTVPNIFSYYSLKVYFIMTNYTCYNTAISVEPYNNDGQKSNLNGKVCED